MEVYAVRALYTPILSRRITMPTFSRPVPQRHSQSTCSSSPSTRSKPATNPKTT